MGIANPMKTLQNILALKVPQQHRLMGSDWQLEDGWIASHIPLA